MEGSGSETGRPRGLCPGRRLVPGCRPLSPPCPPPCPRLRGGRRRGHPEGAGGRHLRTDPAEGAQVQRGPRHLRHQGGEVHRGHEDRECPLLAPFTLQGLRPALCPLGPPPPVPHSCLPSISHSPPCLSEMLSCPSWSPCPPSAPLAAPALVLVTSCSERLGHDPGTDCPQEQVGTRTGQAAGSRRL